MATAVDIETRSYWNDDPTATSVVLKVVNSPDPYAGLNRAQRRKAMAVENRAERKRRKKR